jgi:spectrin beta
LASAEYGYVAIDGWKGAWLTNHAMLCLTQSLAKYGTLTPGKSRIHQITNMSVVFKYLRKTVKIVAIGTHDIVDGNPSLTLGLIWSIIVFFVTKDVGQKNTDFGQYKQALIQWAQRMISENPEFKDQIIIKDLTSSFADGRAFQAMLHQTTQGTFAYAPTDDVVESLTRAFDFAADHYGIARILDPNDVHCCADEKAMVAYLSEFMHKVAGTNLVPPSQL